MYRTIINLALRALNTVPNCKGIPGLSDPSLPQPFNESFSSYELAAYLQKFLDEDAGFTVVMSLPNNDGDVHVRKSTAQTLDAAVEEIAADLLLDGAVDVSEDILLLDVMPGTNHDTVKSFSPPMVIRFSTDGAPRVLYPSAACKEDSILSLLATCSDSIKDGRTEEIDDIVLRRITQLGFAENEIETIAPWAARLLRSSAELGVAMPSYEEWRRIVETATDI